LLGGSLLRAAATAGRAVWGAASGDDAAAARAAGFDATTDTAQALRRAAESDALVVLAVPLPAVDEVLTLVARHAPECLLTDVTSVKAPVAAAVRERVPNVRYAGGHPMAGTTESGWAAAAETLFDGAIWALALDADTVRETWK